MTTTHNHVTEHRVYNPLHPSANSPEIPHYSGYHGNRSHGTYQVHPDNRVVPHGNHNVYHGYHDIYHGNHHIHHGNRVMHHGNHGLYPGNGDIYHTHHGNLLLLDTESDTFGYTHRQPYRVSYHGNHALHGHHHGNHHNHHLHHHHNNYGPHCTCYHGNLNHWPLHDRHDQWNHHCIHHRQREGCCHAARCGCNHGNGGYCGNSGHCRSSRWCCHANHPHPYHPPLPSPPSPKANELPSPPPKRPSPLPLECPICKLGKHRWEGCAVCDTLSIQTKEVTMPDLQPAPKISLRKPKVIVTGRSEAGSTTVVKDVRQGTFDHYAEDHEDLSY